MSSERINLKLQNNIDDETMKGYLDRAFTSHITEIFLRGQGIKHEDKLIEVE